MDGSIFTSLANHISHVIESRLGDGFGSIRVHGGNNEDGRHFHFHVTHTPTQRTLRISVDLELLLSLSSEKMALWFDNLIRGIENGFCDGWATVDYRWMDDGSIAMPPAPPTHSSWLPAHDWLVDYDPIDHMPPPIPPPPPLGTWQPPDQWHYDASNPLYSAWDANYNAPAFNPTEEIKQKLSEIAAILERRFFGGVDVSFTINSHSSGRIECQACFKHFGNRKVSKDIFTEVILSQPILWTVENIYNDIAEFAHRNFDDVTIYDANRQTQELDPQEEFGGPDWAEDPPSKKGIVIKVQGWQTLNQVLEESKADFWNRMKNKFYEEAMLTGVWEGVDFDSLTSKKKPASKNDGKAKGRKKK